MKTKIVPVNYTDDLEKLSVEDKNCYYIGIDEMSITYVQPADTNSMSDEIQTIKLTSRTAMAINIEDAIKKEGFYIDIEIPEGQHWSIDDADGLVAIIDDFKRKLYLNNDEFDEKR